MDSNETKLAVITGTVTALLLEQQTLLEMLGEKELIDKAEFDQRLKSKIGEILPDITRAMLSVANYLEKEPSKELKDVIADEVAEQMDSHGNYILDSITKACIETYGKVSEEFIQSFVDATNLRDELRKIIREEIQAVVQQDDSKEG